LEYYGFITPRKGIYNSEGVESLRLCLSTRAHCEKKRTEVSFKIP
jgi:hypothetical protein